MIPARDLLDEARRLVAHPAARSRGWWARASALLGRQALERCLAALLIRRGAIPPEIPFRVQLLVLPSLVEPELAHRVAGAWAALSAATHHHGYELPPTDAELVRWLETVGELVEVTERRVG